MGRIAKRIVDEDPGDFFRIDALAVTEDGRALEVVDVGNDGAVAAHALFDFFSNLIRFSRPVDDAFIKGRHGARNVIG